LKYDLTVKKKFNVGEGSQISFFDETRAELDEEVVPMYVCGHNCPRISFLADGETVNSVAADSNSPENYQHSYSQIILFQRRYHMV